MPKEERDMRFQYMSNHINTHTAQAWVVVSVAVVSVAVVSVAVVSMTTSTRTPRRRERRREP